MMNRRNRTKKLSLIFLIALTTLSAPTTAATTGVRPRGDVAQRTAPATRTAPKPAATPAPRQTPPKPSTQGTPTAAGPVARSTVNAPTEDCGCEAKPLPEVLAIVNGIKIARQDISAETQQRTAQLRQQVIEARKHELDLQINSLLLEAEAKKLGTSAARLLETEVMAKVSEPTEAEALTFYNQNKAKIDAQAGRAVEFKDVRNFIVGYLQNQRQQEQAGKFSLALRTAAQVRKLVEAATPPATAADRARIFATVNGRNITSGDIEDSLRPLIFTVQEETYKLQNLDVELKINDLLLEQEAQKRKITARALLEAEVTSHVPTVTEADAQKFYNENKERINGDFTQTKYQIIQYLQEREKERLTLAFAERLRSSAQIQTFLTPPEPPVYAIATDDQPSKGNPQATVTIVEFTDFQCPSCAMTHPVIERLANEYQTRIRVVMRDFPLAQHEHAVKAAEAAEAAREQGKYWEYAAILFRNQSSLQVDKLKEYATQLGLDRAKFDAALDSGRFTEKVRRDVQDGQRIGVNATPTVFVNGRRITDRSYEGLKAIIEAALKAPAR
jgi:protein-disulfide isomerase